MMVDGTTITMSFYNSNGEKVELAYNVQEGFFITINDQEYGMGLREDVAMLAKITEAFEQALVSMKIR